MYRWAQAQQYHARPPYLWGTLNAARAAKALGCERVVVAEFGVAGGNGLLALEQAAATTERLLGVQVTVTGFDIGTGMPTPKDERDVPWAIQPGVLPMDEPALRARLGRAQLVIGPVDETVPAWAAGLDGAVGFAAFDLDMYSSTLSAFALFDAPSDRLLPRICCYFDDIFGYGWNDFTGERAAIAEFNETHKRRKIAPIYGLKYELPDPDRALPWPEQIYLAHIFDSTSYTRTEWTIPDSWVAAHRLNG